jgi:AI-2 transport protein TqsA
MNVSLLASTLLIVFGSIVALIYAKPIMVPFVLALLFYFLIRAIHRFINKSRYVRDFIPSWLKNLLSAVFLFTLLGLITNMLIINAEELINTFSTKRNNLLILLNWMHEKTGFDLEQTVNDKLNQLDYTVLANSLLNNISSFFGNMLMIFFYILFLFIEEATFRSKMRLIFQGDRFRLVKTTINNMERRITHYIGLKTFIALISGLCTFFVCLGFGVDAPLFWLFLVTICNFIPILGSMVSMVLPFVFSIVQFGEFMTPLLFLLVLGSLLTVIGNFLEPWLMGDSLNISPLVALISLVFWGMIWGIMGMVISVPITVILIIFLSQFPKSKPIAILLSHSGKI